MVMMEEKPEAHPVKVAGGNDVKQLCIDPEQVLCFVHPGTLLCGKMRGLFGRTGCADPKDQAYRTTLLIC
ncbi:MAG TPA: hypothetical protein OIM17_07060 [Clostridiales bacterium]|nr:hypothetical protein [Clostridiales bacterium]